MTAYEWAITKDYVGDNSKTIGIVGPRGATRSAREIADHPESKQFRLVDDDGVILVGGYIVENRPDYCHGFEPLEDFGEPSLGATEIYYLENGEWSQL